ncbi:hypothetical protein SEUCBS139899_002045 [Sporothrix eucalyptigena]
MEMNYRPGEVAQIQEELHVEIVPGTEIMTDVGNHHFVKSEGHNHGVLVPQPSQDPHDPLNWSPFWKASTITAASTVSFTQGFAPLALAPFFPYLMVQYDRTLSDVIQFTGVTILVLGFSNFLWIPIMSSFGRRPVLILSQLVCLASHIWRAKATTYNSFMGAAILSGIGSGPGETLQPAIIADIFFLHDRGMWNTLYWVTYMGALVVAPVVSGALAEHGGWPNFWWLSAGLTGLSLLLVVFGFPETKWHRIHPSKEQGVPKLQQESSKIFTEHDDRDASATELGEMPPSSINASVTTGNQLQHAATRSYDEYLGKGRPGRRQWHLFQLDNVTGRRIFLDLWVPWRMFTCPIVLFASFIVSWSASNMLILNLTQSQVFGATPYNWSAQSVGFTNFAIFVGTLIGLATGGPLSDWVSARATARNGGVREPEMRLPALIPYALLVALGNIIVAVGYAHGWPWQPIIIVGYGCAGIQLAALPSIASTYAVDSYKPAAGSLFVAITVNKNLWGYGLGKFVTEWSEQSG